jgi:tryptophanyl-tRNA synthetase
VGRDQVQHIEMAQDMAGHLNALYGDCLRRPEALVESEVPTIPGLDGQKMSKSYKNTIEVFVAEKALRKQVMAIKTDGAGLDDPKTPETDNVFALYKLVATPAEVDDMAARYRAGGFGYGHAKQRLADALDAHLAAPRERYHALLADPSTLEDVLRDGAGRARAVARDTLDRVRERVGLPRLSR